MRNGRALFVQLLQAQQRTLGLEHPDTVSTMQKMAHAIEQLCLQQDLGKHGHMDTSRKCLAGSMPFCLGF